MLNTNLRSGIALAVVGLLLAACSSSSESAATKTGQALPKAAGVGAGKADGSAANQETCVDACSWIYSANEHSGSGCNAFMNDENGERISYDACVQQCANSWRAADAACLTAFDCTITGYMNCFGESCQPVCEKQGTEQEGWYNPCDGSMLIPTQCGECASECRDVGTRDEGWYDTCHDKMITPLACGKFDGASPANTCQPICQNVGTRSEGWYDSCDGGGSLLWAACGTCSVSCVVREGSPEGWYEQCSGKLVKAYDCSDEDPPAGNGCRPVCGNIGTRSEGWMNPCEGNELIRWDNCEDKDVICGEKDGKTGWFVAVKDSSGAVTPGALVLEDDCRAE